MTRSETAASSFLNFLAAWMNAKPWQRDLAAAYLGGLQAPYCDEAYRTGLEDTAEAAIALLDQIDGDPAAEIETDFDLNPISLQGVDRVPPKRITMRRAA